MNAASLFFFRDSAVRIVFPVPPEMGSYCVRSQVVVLCFHSDTLARGSMWWWPACDECQVSSWSILGYPLVNCQAYYSLSFLARGWGAWELGACRQIAHLIETKSVTLNWQCREPFTGTNSAKIGLKIPVTF